VDKKYFYWIVPIFVILASLASPTVYDIIYDTESKEVSILDGGAVDEQSKFAFDFARLLIYAEEQGYQVSLGETYRTMYQQRHYVAIGRSWTYNSMHLKRRGGDLNLFLDGRYLTTVDDYRPLGEYWKSLDSHNQWGGDWKRTPDAPHFQRR